MRDLIPGRVEDVHYLNARRHDSHLSIPKAITTGFHNSYFPSTTKLWNDIPREIKEATLHESFKEKLEKTKIPRPHFNQGSRRASILHARLHIRCSDLNDDKFRIGLTEDPTCACGAGREDGEHYIFMCVNYDLPRIKLLN